MGKAHQKWGPHRDHVHFKKQKTILVEQWNKDKDVPKIIGTWMRKKIRYTKSNLRCRVEGAIAVVSVIFDFPRTSYSIKIQNKSMGAGVEREQKKASEQVGRGSRRSHALITQASSKLITPNPIMIGLFECPTKSNIQKSRSRLPLSQPLIVKISKFRTLILKI
jgi:hypothetical protein